MEKSEVFNASKVVEDYSSSVEELKKITTEITKTASDGRPISEELRSKLNKELDGLKTHYTNLCEKAHKISKDIPENPSIYDLQKIIEEYDKISSELSEIKEILTKFIRVTSKEPKYADAIRPYQDKARDIVEQIDNKTVGKEIVSSDTCKGAKCFTNALDNAMDNKNYADLDEETRDSLENIFKPKVISGLAANKYFLPPDKNHAESDDSAENKVVESEPEPVPVVETKKENTTVEESDNKSDDSNKQKNHETEKDTKKTKSIAKHTKMHDPAIMLSLVKHCGVITYDQAFRCLKYLNNKILKRDIEIWLDELNKEGFISAIIISSKKEKFFCLRNDPWAGKTLNKEEESEIIKRKEEIDSSLERLEKEKSSHRPETLISTLAGKHSRSLPKPNEPEIEQTVSVEQSTQVEPETISPEAATEEPIKQIVQEEPAKQEELIEEIHAEQIPETEPEQKQEQEPEKPEETVKPEELEEPEKAEQIAETKEPEEIDEAENQEKDHLTTICELINSDKIYCATAYAKATNSPFYEALAYAVDDPDDPKAERDYLSTNIQELNKITEERDFIEPLILAAAIRTFFSGRNTYDDYSLPSLYSTIQGSDFETADKNPKLKDVIFKLFTFKNEHRKGMDCYVSQDTEYFDKKFNELKKETSQFIDLIEKSPVKIYDPKFLETKKLLFDNKGELIKFLELTKESKDKKLQQEISGFLKGNFIKEESNISHGNIDNQKIRKYIDLFWEKAKTNRALTGDPLTILTNELKRCITILINWINLIDEMPTESDKGTSDYKNSRKSMISDLEAAKEEINKSIDQHGNNIKKQAGLKIVEYTVEEIKNCIDNNRSIEDSKKYFYIDFLKTPDILLDEKYIPNFDSFPSDPVSLLPENRILQHCKNVANDSPVGKRLENIADDYGSAELILRYLQDINLEPENIDSIQKCINTGKRNAKKAAEEKKEDFTGELELAFAYGQLDISTEDEILNAVNNYSEKYMKDNNYGFFDRVLKSYREDIKAKAEIRKTVITEQLETFKEKIYEMSVEDQNKIINQIEDFIRQGNYTVVESLFANPKIILEDNENLSNEDFLKTFIDNYKTYHEPIAKDEIFGIIVKPFVTKRENSKDILEMAQCWFPSVADDNIGEKKLKTLLEHLGFNEINLERIETEAGKAGKPIYESYTVKSKKYTIFLHPIAALGSEMMSKDIRIVCIRKTLNADQIMDTITQISKDKQHTVILLDCALSLTDRRRLAKRSKAELGNKLFAVIDRTVMMFMCMHYDNTKMNRMLMALIMPFTYYQPYACNSENPIPPEMFIGRKEELDLIKAPNRVHIVYGGRQLGKSALLARAAWDINNNEKGGKAVLITIKNDDYKEAAKKIYKELINSKILLENSVKDPCDWKELADAIKHKLNNSKEISYLLLLLDEADKFIRTCEDVNFAPLDALADIQKTGKFKFVIAGLRDIVKFNRERVIGGNTIIAHLESMTVKPFTASEAKELLEIPLRYLGLRFPKGQEYLIYLILANTNYFPGLIQMYCAKLLEAMKKEKYAGYKEAATPPYEISKEHIKKALSDKDFKVEIFKKFEITLGLTDDDNEYYYIIARIIAYLHHERNNSSGYSPKDIIECGKDLEINKIAEMEPQQLEALLEELTELNILNATDNHYMFTRYNFFQMLGKKSDIGNKLYEYIGK